MVREYYVVVDAGGRGWHPSYGATLYPDVWISSESAEAYKDEINRKFPEVELFIKPATLTY